MFLEILNRYFKGFYMPKNTFFEGTKKISVQKNFWDFLYMYKGGLCKKKHCSSATFHITSHFRSTLEYVATNLTVVVTALSLPYCFVMIGRVWLYSSQGLDTGE